MEKVRYGIVGLGNQGTFYALQIFQAGKIDNGYVSAMCDINPKKIEIMKEKYLATDAKYFESCDEMIASGLCDAVIIATPHYDHPTLVVKALQAGIHVICDKPAGVYTKQVREMNEEAEKYHAKFAMMFNQRTNCLYRKMREIVQSGGIGKLQRVNWIITDWFRTQSYYDSGNWRATWEGEGGGVLINQCPHQIDLVQWVVGEMPATVRGFCEYGKWHDIEVEDEVTAFFEYESGATGVFITTTGEAPGDNRFEITGTKGKLLCEGGKLVWYKNAVDCLEFSATSSDGFKQPEREIVEVETDGENYQHAGIIRNFTNAILGTEEQFVQGKEGIFGVELMNAIELSGWKGGEKVVLPVNEEEYLRELNKRRQTSRLKAGREEKVIDPSVSFGSAAKYGEKK